MTQKTLIYFLIFGTFLESNASELSKYVGQWEDTIKSKGLKITLKENGQCILFKDNKIIVKETDCIWDKTNHIVYYKVSNKKESFYFKLDNNELILEEDKRSLTREKADSIMHKIN